jgi:DNA-binding GntR family transcriptional regulator
MTRDVYEPRIGASRTTQAQLSRVVDTHAAIVDAIEAQLAMKAADLMIVHFEKQRMLFEAPREERFAGSLQPLSTFIDIESRRLRRDAC